MPETRTAAAAVGPTAAPAGRGLPGTDLVLLAVSIAGISSSAPLISATAAPVLAIACWRNVMSVGVLGPYALLRHRDELRGLTRRPVLLAMAAGVLLAAHFALWMPSLRMTSVASATALVTTTPLWTIMLLRLAGHRVPRLVRTGMITAFAGVLVLTGVDLGLSTRALAGDALALAAGLAAAGYMLLGAEVRRTVSTTAYTLVCYTTTAVVLLALCLATGTRMNGWPPSVWGQIALLMVVAQLLGHSLSNRVVRTLGPTVTSTAILLETPGAALIAAVWLGQLPPAAAWPALLLILAGLVLVVRGGRK
ncbi:DMT family transporter [Kitasatospora viridis]|uniref:Threonine/homoserine efflux transporter RhtA n=1 Tax=Kitasatospora viridis TaxID=281105 RepID=A0A561UFB6_9ACTN|nr:threonine/homoserine efflux transporter RhtA [Kitasatospora viridis]